MKNQNKRKGERRKSDINFSCKNMKFNPYQIVALFVTTIFILILVAIYFTFGGLNLNIGFLIAYLLFVFALGFFIYNRFTSTLRRKKRIINTTFPTEWKRILEDKVFFYKNLEDNEKMLFENDIQVFLATTRITGIQESVTDTDKLLIASSAVIPVFGFPGWEYDTLDEVLLYPKSFNQYYETKGDGTGILGMVGSGGEMENKMILSKPALHKGFSLDSDKKNVGIHEFVHLIDKADGKIDGVPQLLMKNQYALPWLDLIHKKMEQIFEGKSDINPYGATNKIEFFAVASEYFFERPKLLQSKHPELYKRLEKVFRQDMVSILKHQFKKTKIGRNDPCPCGSGKKFKLCCGAKS